MKTGAVEQPDSIQTENGDKHNEKTGEHTENLEDRAHRGG